VECNSEREMNAMNQKGTIHRNLPNAKGYSFR
jgi:hypothetical protein